MKHVVIIGNGIAGITAARHIRKNSNFQITVISSESKHFWSRTALMYIYMGHMQYEHTKPYPDSFWSENNINLLHNHVNKITTEEKKLSLNSNEEIHYDYLIIATGSKPNTPNWPGNNLKGVCTMVSLQDLEKIEAATKNIREAVVIGGGLIGIELVEMLRTRNINTKFLIRENQFWGSALPSQVRDLLHNHIEKHGVNLLTETELKEIESDSNGNVAAVITKSNKRIPCQFVGIATGVSPNTSITKATNIATNKGILIDPFLKTSQDDVFAIGDCAEKNYSSTERNAIEPIWYAGRMMGETVAQTICGKPTKYTPGPWFNSAKFFNIEYQTYGEAKNTITDNQLEFYWENTQKEVAIHITFDKSNTFKGIHSFGIRLRHEIMDKWLQSEKSIQHVIQNFREANFDPEFFTRYETNIREAFNNEYPSLAVSTPKQKKILGIFNI